MVYGARVLDEASALTADTLRLALGIGLLVVAFHGGRWVSDRTGRLWHGWAAGLAILLAIGIPIQYAREALRGVSCQTVNPADRSACEAGDLSTE